MGKALTHNKQLSDEILGYEQQLLVRQKQPQRKPADQVTACALLSPQPLGAISLWLREDIPQVGGPAALHSPAQQP